MRYLQISTVMSYGSIGRIMRQNYDEKKEQGWECLIAYGRGESVEGYNSIRIGTNIDVKLQGLETRLFDRHGYGTKNATKEFIKQAEVFNPDVIHLHNLHGYYINFELLFDWVKAHPERQVLWTLHDCWAFTGHCSHFSAIQCMKWKVQCVNCAQKNRYPASYFIDNCKENYIRKKNAFTGVKDMTIITPSYWHANLIKQSFLKEYSIEVKYNQIDKNIFKPTHSDFRKKYGIENKKMLLGVASVWEERKGLKEFIRMSEKLDDNYAIVLVGLSEKQIAKMPDRIIGITRTNDTSELAGIYTTADLFINPSVEETFGLTTVEALACGTPAIVYKGTACEEIANKYGGCVVEQDMDELIQAVFMYTK